MAGRPPKPTKLKQITGNPGRRPLNSAEPVPHAGIPEMPDGLTRVAQAEWKRLLPILSGMGVLTVADGASLAAYCQTFARRWEAEEAIDENGVIVKEPIVARLTGDVVGHRIKKNPALTARTECLKLERAFLADFGLSPAARTRVSTTTGDKPDDPMEQFLADEGEDASRERPQ